MKRAIALFLALIFVFGLIPVSALAATQEITIKFADTIPDTDTVPGRLVVPGGGARVADSGDPQLTKTNKSVKITAEDTFDGKAFLYWKIGNSGKTTETSYQVGHTVSSNIDVTPVYGNKLTLTVVDGKGSGTYANDESIKVTANTPDEGESFVRWEVVSGDAASMLSVFPDTSATFDTTAMVGNEDVALTLRAIFTGNDYKVNFDTSGVAVARNNMSSGDDFLKTSPATAQPGDTVYVRVAEKTGTGEDAPKDRKVTGVSVLAGITDIETSEIAGQESDGFVTYSFVMPTSDVTVSASYLYKISLYDADKRAAFNAETNAALSNWPFVAPGTKVLLAVEPDGSERTITNWVFSPVLDADKCKVEDNVITGASGDVTVTKGVATFTMPSEPLAITVKYDRELVKYSLNVTNGTAKLDGAATDLTLPAEVEEGEAVTVTPNTVTDGRVFQEWQATGDTAFVNYINSLTPGANGVLTIAKMPKGSGTLTAMYVGTYKLTTQGAATVKWFNPDLTPTPGYATATGDVTDQNAAYGKTVTITAPATDAAGSKFTHWDYTRKGVSEPANVTGDTSRTTTFDMPAGGSESGGSLTVSASYAYLVTVQGGGKLGNGETSDYFAPGATVKIIAATPASGQVFKNWTEEDDAASTGKAGIVFADDSASTTTFVMPEQAVTVKANEGAAYEASIGNSNGTIAVKGHTSTSTAVKAAEGTLLTATASATVTSSGTTYVFNRWTAKKKADSSTIALEDADGNSVDLKKRALTFKMKDMDVVLTPSYTNQYATVTVNNGTGGGTYANGASVTIKATVPAGKEFRNWTLTYYESATATTTKTIEVAGSSYTFTMGTSYPLRNIVATANFTQLYKLTLRNGATPKQVDGELKMTRPASSTEPISEIASTAGQTAISAYWRAGNVITIETPAEDASGNAFTGWRIVSGSGTLASATSATTTFKVAAENTVLLAQYGSNMLIYKTAERDDVHLYDNWSYEAREEGDLITLTAEDPDDTFVAWACTPSDLIRSITKSTPTGKDDTITFNMPTGTVKVWPVYGHKLTLTDAYYSLDNRSTWTLADPDNPIAITTGKTVWIKPLTGVVGTATGKRVFASWVSNSTRISSQYSTAEISFTMPPEDVEAYVNYKKYTLTVYRTVAGTPETYALMPGEYITLSSEDASGGRCFNYWTHTAGLTFTVNDENWDSFDKSLPDAKQRLVSQRITVQMPASDAYIQAHYSMYPSQEYWNTDASIRIEGEPKRYYALLEYFQPYDMKVIYYAGALSTGVEVDPSDYEILIVKAGTYEVATTTDKCFTQEGEFDLLITMRVNGVQMAPTIRVMNEASTHLYCTAMRPEFVRTYTKPSRTVYYEGEEVSKDGMDVELLSVYHVSGTMRYSVARELNESEYKLKPWGTGWDADGKTNTKLPTIEEIKKKIEDKAFGYRLQNGEYQVCMEITDCFDYSQFNSDGSYMRMEYIVNDLTDYIWVTVKPPIENIALTAYKGGNASDQVNDVASTTYPFVAWDIWESTAMAIDKGRTLTITADGYTDKNAIYDAIEIVNSDSNVAYLMPTADKLIWKVIAKSPGVTTITVRARGNNEIKATCEITVHSDTEPVPMTELTALNLSTVNLYVGTKQTLYPTTYMPSNADKTCNWAVVFTDGLLPQNAEYYVSVNQAGAVEVLKYTDRPVRIYALPTYPAGQNTLEKAQAKEGGVDNDCVFATCDITVLQIPVDNMTLYPTGIKLYRLASKSLKATLYPEAASDKTIRWTSSDSSVASVVDGVVTANKLGTATITATSESNPSVYQTCTVTVAQSVLLTGLTLNKTNATLGIEDTMVLTPYYTPATATTKSVTWESNASSVATVDANGKVRGISEGVAVITATANDGSGKHVSCVVSVSTIVSSAVVLNKQTLALIEDETETLVATVYPTNVSNSKVNWSSSNEKVATVDPDGVVTATGGGSAVITATARDASTKYADCVVAVTAKIPVTNITLNLGNFDMLLNDTTVLTPTIAPANATYKITWTSSNETVAKVDEKGKVSALATGDAVITCKAGDRTAAITVSVVTKTFSTGKVVNCARRVNVRANSSGGSTIVGYAYLGDVYRVLDKSGNWYKIQYNATTTAYIWHRYLSATETSAGYVSAGKVGSTTTDTTGTGTATPAPVVTAKSLTITNCTYCVNVRSGAGTNFSRLGYAYLDESFTYTGVTGDWYIITYNGATAYVSSQFVKVNG